VGYRPLDWSPVGLSSDPVPGDPAVVRQGGWDYQSTADSIKRAGDSLRAIEDGGMVSLALDAVMECKTEAVDNIAQAYSRYHDTGVALVDYASELAACQEAADAALADAAAAESTKTSALRSQRTYVNLRSDSDDVDDRRRYQRQIDNFQDDVDSANSSIGVAKAAVGEAKARRDRAAQTAIAKIQQVVGSDGLNDSWWDDWGSKLAEILDVISGIAGVLAIVVAFIPVVGQVLAGVLLVVSAVTAIASAGLKVVAAAQGHTSFADAAFSVVMAALACTGLGALKALSSSAKGASSLIKTTSNTKSMIRPKAPNQTRLSTRPIRQQNTGNGTVTYRRVQGGGSGNKTSQQRIKVNDDGTISIAKKDSDLNISIDEAGDHAQYFLRERRVGGQIVEFEVPKWFDDFVRETAIKQDNYRTNPLNQGGAAPKIVDPKMPGTAVELPDIWPQWLEEVATNARIV
jgi:hypothetical protein